MKKESQVFMPLDIRSRNVAVTSELRQHIERRVGQALNRFERHIGVYRLCSSTSTAPREDRTKYAA